MSFIFISYSRQDQAYVSTLVQVLQSHRLPIWIDDRIDYGSTWPRVIQDQLEKCAVFLVVMSPRSEDSHWVQCELSLALELKKPIFPLLLEGRRWLSVAAIQSVDVAGSKLPDTRFFETLRGYFPTTATVAESLPIQTVVDEQIPPAPATTVRTAKETAPRNQEVELKSEKGIDYTRLRDLLQAGEWRDADLEAWHRMLEAVGRGTHDWIRADELCNFPCADLKTIDQLWQHYSAGKFGFSVQKKIWEEYGSPAVSCKDWLRFCVKVGWQDKAASRYLKYNELRADPSFSPTGEFPSFLWF